MTTISDKDIVTFYRNMPEKNKTNNFKNYNMVKTEPEGANTLIVTNPENLNSDNVPGSIMFRNLTVTRQHCIDLSLLTSYFRFLRHYSDDTLQSILNDSEKPDVLSKLNRCNTSVEALFENWSIRRTIINFCDQEAAALKKDLDTTFEKDNKKIITEARIDSYALRDLENEKTKYYYNYNKIIQWVNQQQGVESILQDRANDVLRRSCDQNENYMKQFHEFYKNLKK